VDKNRVSRRSALKRIGAGTAIAWSAPILTSLRAPAFGQYGPTCLPGQDSCNGPDFNCQGLSRCFCTNTAEGAVICGCFDRGACGGYQLCTATATCPTGEFCAVGPDCCGGICLPLCTPQCGGGVQPNAEGVHIPPATP
jgi:hypothetical protein